MRNWIATRGWSRGALCVLAGLALGGAALASSVAPANSTPATPATPHTTPSKPASSGSKGGTAAHKTTAHSSPAHKSAHKSAGAKGSSHGASAQKTSRSRGQKAAKNLRSSRKRGQQAIDGARARAIQQALIREHYLDGQPSGTWDNATQAAMQRYQADQGWQSKTTPDSRALIKLGLGPSNDHLLNPESAMTSSVSGRAGAPAADPKPQTDPPSTPAPPQ